MEYTCPYCGTHQNTANKVSSSPSSSNFPWLLAQDTPRFRNEEYMSTDYCAICKKPVLLFKEEGVFIPCKTCGGVGLNQWVGVDCPHCGQELIIAVSGDFTPLSIAQQQRCTHCEELISVEIETDGHVQVEEIPTQDYPCPYCGGDVSFAGHPEEEFLAAFCNHCDALLAVVQEEDGISMEKTYENEGMIDEDFSVTCPRCGEKNLPQVSVHPVGKTFHLVCHHCETPYHYRCTDDHEWEASKD